MEQQNTTNNEVDLFKLLLMLWKEKLIIMTAMSTVVVIAFVYTQFAAEKYRISTGFIIDLHSVNSKDLCSGVSITNSGASIPDYSLDCLNSEMKRNFLNAHIEPWKVHRGTNMLELTTDTPLAKEKYINFFRDVADKISLEVLNEAKNEIHLIETEIKQPFLSSEKVAENVLTAKRLILAIGQEKKVITFSSPKVEQIWPRTAFIFLLAIMLGCIIGLFAVFIRVILNKKRR